MHLKTDPKTLSAALTKAVGVINNRNTLPILDNVYLKAEDNTLTICATDLDSEVSTRIECEVIKAGETTVNARLLSDGVKKFADGRDRDWETHYQG